MTALARGQATACALYAALWSMQPTHTPMYGLHRALYDGFAMAFMTQLNEECAPRIDGLLQRAFNPQNSKAREAPKPSRPLGQY